MIMWRRLWKNQCVLSIMCAIAFLVETPMTAAGERSGYYFAARGVGAVSSMEGVSSTGFSNTIRLQNDSDTVAGLGAAIGYKWNNLPVHSEIEMLHLFRFDFDVRDDGPADSDTGYEVNVSTTVMLFNLLWDFRLDGSVTPYAGGTLGWVRNTAETERRVINTGVLTSQEASTDNFAWGGMVGVVWDFDKNWAADVAYRHINLGEVDTGLFPGGDSVTADDYVSNDLVLSILYRF